MKESHYTKKEVVEKLQKALLNSDYIDIGAGAEKCLDVTRTKFCAAVAELKELGYNVYYIKIEQLGEGISKTVKILAKPQTRLDK